MRVWIAELVKSKSVCLGWELMLGQVCVWIEAGMGVCVWIWYLDLVGVAR